MSAVPETGQAGLVDRGEPGVEMTMTDRDARSAPELARTAVAGDSGREALPAGAVRVLRDRLKANDPVWLGYHVLDRAAAKVSRFFDGRARARERARDLPGVNTREYNRLLWTAYDWSHDGEEWTPSVEWRESAVAEVLTPLLPSDAHALEIGPGAGRWTRELLPRVRSLALADISERAIELCQERFGRGENLSYLVTDGNALRGIADGSIDFVWSFDVFLHIAPVDQKGYLRELARVMRPGALAVVHHPGDGGSAEGWRSAMTAELFAELVTESGMRVHRQFARWGAGDRFSLPNPGDVITVFGPPR